MLVGTRAVFTLVLTIPHYWVKISETLPNAYESWGFPSGWCKQASVSTGSRSFQILQIFLSLALGSFYRLVACWIPKGNPLYSALHASILGCPTRTCLPAVSVSALSQLMEYSKLQLGSSPWATWKLSHGWTWDTHRAHAICFPFCQGLLCLITWYPGSWKLLFLFLIFFPQTGE